MMRLYVTDTFVIPEYYYPSKRNFKFHYPERSGVSIWDNRVEITKGMRLEDELGQQYQVEAFEMLHFRATGNELEQLIKYCHGFLLNRKLVGRELYTLD